METIKVEHSREIWSKTTAWAEENADSEVIADEPTSHRVSIEEVDDKDSPNHKEEKAGEKATESEMEWLEQ